MLCPQQDPVLVLKQKLVYCFHALSATKSDLDFKTKTSLWL